jgi:hypothetical protein
MPKIDLPKRRAVRTPNPFHLRRAICPERRERLIAKHGADMRLPELRTILEGCKVRLARYEAERPCPQTWRPRTGRRQSALSTTAPSVEEGDLGRAAAEVESVVNGVLL